MFETQNVGMPGNLADKRKGEKVISDVSKNESHYCEPAKRR